MITEPKTQPEPKNKRLHRFAEVETLAKRLYFEILPIWAESSTRDECASWSFDSAEIFLAERDRRKADRS